MWTERVHSGKSLKGPRDARSHRLCPQQGDSDGTEQRPWVERRGTARQAREAITCMLVCPSASHTELAEPHGVLGFGTMTGSVTDRPRPEQRGRRLVTAVFPSASPPLLHLPLSTCRCRTCGRGPRSCHPSLLSPATQPAPRGLFQCRGWLWSCHAVSLGICPLPCLHPNLCCTSPKQRGACPAWDGRPLSDTQKSQS